MNFNEPKNLFPAHIENQEQGDDMTTPFKLPLETYRPTQNHFFAGLYLRAKDGSLPIKIMPSTDTEKRAVFVRAAVNSHASLTSALDACLEALAQALAVGQVVGESKAKCCAALEQAKKARK